MKIKNFIQLLSVAGVLGTLMFIAFVKDKTIAGFFTSLLISFVYTLFIGAGNMFINNYFNKFLPWFAVSKWKVVLRVVLIVIINVILCYVCSYIHFVLITKGASTEEFFSEKYNFTHWSTINIALLVSAFLHAKDFMQKLHIANKKEVVEQQIIASSANAQFESLKNQLDPHFLFNSLNVLSAIIEENPQQAQKFTNDMSKIYRYVLDQKDKELVTVEEEIDFARTYANLLKTRFEDSVNFSFEVSDEVLNHYVVPLSLQLLLENAIKHNFATDQKPLFIKIYSENGILAVENNLQQREVLREREGIGISNIVNRYSLISNRNVFIEKSDDYYKVKIPILSQKIYSMNTPTKDQEVLAYEKAAKRVEELKGFYGNLISYCVFIPLLFFINWRSSPEYWWAFWPMFGWGIGVVAHAIGIFGIGKNWEEKQIRKYMNKEEANAKKWK